jgi:hypothetical protein
MSEYKAIAKEVTTLAGSRKAGLRASARAASFAHGVGGG